MFTKLLSILLHIVTVLDSITLGPLLGPMIGNMREYMVGKEVEVGRKIGVIVGMSKNVKNEGTIMDKAS